MRRASSTAALPARRMLTEAESKKILAARRPAGDARSARAQPAEAVRLAAEIGGAVALKIQSPDIPHKSDIGGVHLGAARPPRSRPRRAQVLDECRRAIARTRRSTASWCRKWSTDGVEFILGMTYDEQFGPLIVCGAGGVTVEVFKDAAVLLPPFAARGCERGARRA